MLSVSFNHIAIMKKDGNRAADLLEEQKTNINRPLAAILTLNTIAHTVGAAGVGAEALKIFGSEWVAVTSAVLTLTILIFSEIIPKTLGTVYSKTLASFTAYTVKILTYLVLPFVYLSEAFSKIFNNSSN